MNGNKIEYILRNFFLQTIVRTDIKKCLVTAKYLKTVYSESQYGRFENTMVKTQLLKQHTHK